MSILAPYANRLLTLGAKGRHPASAAVGVQAGGMREVAVEGWARLPSQDDVGAPMTRDSLLDLASVTKVAATTVLAMRLVAADELALDDPVRRYLPYFVGDGKGDITVEHVLTHTGGLRPWWPLYCDAVGRNEPVSRVQELPLATAPGTNWSYSDLGMILAGAVVERVTGQTLAGAFATLVAGPVGIGARFGPVHAKCAAVGADSDAYEYAMIATGSPYAVPFAADDFDGWRPGHVCGEVADGNAAHALSGVAGHAGLFATIDDLLTLGTVLREGEFIPRAILNRFAEPNPIRTSQGVGFRRDTLRVGEDAVTVLGHPGFTGTYFGIAVEHPLVVAGGAMRMHGTVGSIPASIPPPRLPDLVPGDHISGVVRDSGRHVLMLPTPSSKQRN